MNASFDKQLRTGAESGTIKNIETPDVSVAIIILAAGRSRRMSSDAAHELLSTFDGVPVVRRMALRAIESKTSQVHAVAGFRHKEIET